jgi:hypothetical protein
MCRVIEAGKPILGMPVMGDVIMTLNHWVVYNCVYLPSVVLWHHGALVCAMDADGHLNSYRTDDFYRSL